MYSIDMKGKPMTQTPLDRAYELAEFQALVDGILDDDMPDFIEAKAYEILESAGH